MESDAEKKENITDAGEIKMRGLTSLIFVLTRLRFLAKIANSDNKRV